MSATANSAYTKVQKAADDTIPHVQPKLLIAIIAITLACSSAFLFIRLNHYALWDDESLVALIGQGVWRTGDTTAVNGNNIVAYRDGLLLKGFKDRSSPPLQYYIVAPFVGLLGPHAWAVRLPMAMMGLVCVGIMLWWLWVDQADLSMWSIFIIAMLGNVSFFLYFRQCRYYGPSMLFLTLTAYLYVHLKTRFHVLLLGITLLFLLAANYMGFAACAAMLSIDYALWGRNQRSLDRNDWLIILLPLILIGSVIIWIWNPSSIDQGSIKGPWIADRLLLLWWNIRDADVCEYGATIALLAAPLVAIHMRQTKLLRATLALAVGVVVISIASPQKTADATRADVRYLSFLLPLCIAVEALTLRAMLSGRRIWIIGVPAACVLFGTNLLQGGWLRDVDNPPPLRSTVALFAIELADPPPDPYTAAATWINANVAPGASIGVVPDYMRYPLMFHAPKAIYGWQIDNNTNLVFLSVPPVEFKHRVPLDYIITFGRVTPATNMDKRDAYLRVATLAIYGVDYFRPELFLRTFRPISRFNPSYEGISIYKRR